MRCMRIQRTAPCVRCNGTGEIENAAYRGQEMRKLRQATGLPLREVARRMGKSAAYISDLELGRRGWSGELIRAYQKAIR